MVSESDESAHPGRTFPRVVMVKCDCGAEKTITARHMRRGRAKSCGCLHDEVVTKHGNSAEAEYYLWKGMQARCYNTSLPGYRWYGGKGVSVCDEWRNSYLAFKEWLHANGWTMGLQIDRKDNDGNYCPDNCRIVEAVVNANNKGNNRKIVILGDSLTVAEASRKYRMAYDTLFQRIFKLGWSPDKAATTPVRPMRMRGAPV